MKFGALRAKTVSDRDRFFFSQRIKAAILKSFDVTSADDAKSLDDNKKFRVKGERSSVFKTTVHENLHIASMNA